MTKSQDLNKKIDNFDIRKALTAWTDGEEVEAFTRETEWVGDMVEGFVYFCIRSYSLGYYQKDKEGDE